MERYADEFDRASALEEAERVSCINEVRNRKTPSLISVGYCHNCNEELRHPLLFCDEDCADDYELLTAARRRNGG